MLRRLGIRAKVLAVLAVPMLVVLLAGAFISAETLQNLRAEQNVRHIVAAATSSVALTDALNDERAVSQQSGATADQIAAARSKVDDAYRDFKPLLDAVDVSSFTTAISNGIGTVERDFAENLPSVRSDVDGNELRVVSSGYATFVDDQLTLFDNFAKESTNRDVATFVSAYVAVGRTVSSLVQEEVDGGSLLGQSDPTVAGGRSYATLVSQTEVYRAAASAAVADLSIPGVLLPSGDPTATFTRYRNLMATGSAVSMSIIDPQSFLGEIATQRGALTQIADSVFQSADQTSARAITAAEQRAAVTIGITVLAAGASFLLAIVIARTIVVPLRRLTAAATDLREELPKLVEQVQVPGEGPQTAAPHIPVNSRDEVGRLAGAFNAVNETTFRVAQEQAALRGSIAEMFVNVARRDQVLLNRQLSFIDSLERTEEDPQALANLFRLDHLATRMRRNAESLLVLAGIDSGRRLRDALPLSDVVRTASSEIEQYDRVELDLQADPHMLGFNALPAAHLIAELLENATVFSEPETPVVVTTVVTGPFVEVRIADQGLGMSDVELQAANEKIASTSASDALGAQRLGLFVVGRLAQRLSAEVVLRKNSHGPTGTETVVRFPATLFQSTEASPLGVYGEARAAVTEPEVPELTEVDLAALTDGVTEQGLPHRRSAAPAPGGLPVRGAASPSFDEDAIVLPEVETAALPTDLTAAGTDWTPMVVSGQGSGLPNRQPALASGVADSASSERPAAPADPAARAGLFAGFRGRSDLAPVTDEATTTADEPPATVEPVEPVGPGFVVPALAPDEEWAPAATVAPQSEQASTEPWQAGDDAAEPWTPAAEAWGAPVEETAEQPADEVAPSWPSWVQGAPTWGEPSEGYVPAAFAPEVTTSQAAPLFAPGAPEPWVAEPTATSEPVPATSAVAADEVPTTAERWTPPEVDLAQWAVPAQEAPAFEPEPDTFTGLSAWGSSTETQAETAPYAPFERSLDEARAWATGAIPVVPEPAGFPGAETVVPAPAAAPAAEVEDAAEATSWGQWGADEVPQLVPDSDDATAVFTPVAAEAVAAEPVAEVVTEPEVVEQQVDDRPALDAEPVEQPATPAWAPTTGAFDEVVGVEPERSAAAGQRRRGWFGRRKHQEPVVEQPAAPVVVPAHAPVPVASAPTRSSAWAPGADAVAPEPFPLRVPAAEAAAVPAPAAPASTAVPAATEPVTASSTSWSPQASWNPPAPQVLPEPSAGRSVPSWAPPEWAPRPAQTAQAAEPEPQPSFSSSAEPTSAPRIGTLDDEVAAMLALRSDIQEQALSELSQLSAYRPQVVPGADRLTRRVPTAVPEAPEIVESNAERNPNEVRSRLASFQSGTARGRRDAGVDEETS